MVTVYTELSINVQKHKLATLNHNQQENSNLIMPFLVQKDNKMIRGLTIRMKDSKKKQRNLFFLEMRSMSLKCIKLYLCDYKTQNQRQICCRLID